MLIRLEACLTDRRLFKKIFCLTVNNITYGEVPLHRQVGSGVRRQLGRASLFVGNPGESP